MFLDVLDLDRDRLDLRIQTMRYLTARMLVKWSRRTSGKKDQSITSIKLSKMVTRSNGFQLVMWCDCLVPSECRCRPTTTCRAQIHAGQHDHDTPTVIPAPELPMLFLALHPQGHIPTFQAASAAASQPETRHRPGDSSLILRIRCRRNTFQIRAQQQWKES